MKTRYKHAVSIMIPQRPATNNTQVVKHWIEHSFMDSFGQYITESVNSLVCDDRTDVYEDIPFWRVSTYCTRRDLKRHKKSLVLWCNVVGGTLKQRYVILQIDNQTHEIIIY